MKYSDLLAQWLKNMGYTHCFYVAGGSALRLMRLRYFPTNAKPA
jgi:acetolactate synthase-1/2/3 large subunit